MTEREKEINTMVAILEEDECDGYADNNGCINCRSSENTCDKCKEIIKQENKRKCERLYDLGYRKVGKV